MGHPLVRWHVTNCRRRPSTRLREPSTMNPPQQNRTREAPVVEIAEVAAFERDPRTERAAASPALAAAHAVRRHPLAFALPLIACLALAVVGAAVHAPTYTAEAKLGIGRIDVNTYSIPGFVEASRGLAAAYSRALETPAVTGPVARRLGIGASELGARLSASPVPESPVIVV